MTVAELIVVLQSLPPDRPVFAPLYLEGAPGEIQRAETMTLTVTDDHHHHFWPYDQFTGGSPVEVVVLLGEA